MTNVTLHWRSASSARIRANMELSGMTIDDEKRRMKRKHIFIVNGDPYFLELLRELFQDERYNVTTTNFVPETFDQIETLKPALIIIDLVVGEQAGWDLLEQLQHDAVTARIPVLVTSTNPEYLEAATANEERYGVDSFIAKPMDVEILLEEVHKLAGRP
jgi:response regulator RpfG family c-di-GMP phosphodiesterase